MYPADSVVPDHFSQTNMISRNTKIIGFLQMKMRRTDTKLRKRVKSAVHTETRRRGGGNSGGAVGVTFGNERKIMRKGITDIRCAGFLVGVFSFP